MFNPKVSIVIPVYNGSNYLWEAIDSALAQTYQNIEVLVVNDWSTDNWETEKIAKSYWEKIIYFYKKNGGVSTALNMGIKNMRWDYFSWLSHDDVYYPNKIEEQVKELHKLPRDKHYLMYSDFDEVDKNWKVLKHVCLGKQSKNKIFNVFIRGMVHGCTTLIHKSVFEDVWYFNNKLLTVQDTDMWLRIIAKYDMYHIPHILIQSRHHTQQDSNTKKDLHTLEKKNLENDIFDNLRKKYFRKYSYIYFLVQKIILLILLKLSKNSIIKNIYQFVKKILKF